LVPVGNDSAENGDIDVYPSGTFWEATDDNPPDYNTTYIYFTGTDKTQAPEDHWFEMDNITATPFIVDYININILTYNEWSGGNTHYFIMGLRNDTDEDTEYYYHTPESMDYDTWYNWSFNLTTNPLTNQDWTKDDINHLSVKVGLQDNDATGDARITQVRVVTYENQAPYIHDEKPTNGSISGSLSPTVNITATDNNSDIMTVTFASNYSGDWINYQTTNNVKNGDNISWDFTAASDPNTKYFWRVYADDGIVNVSETYDFTTDLYWNEVDNTINGSYTNTTHWTTADDTINGSYTNTTTYHTVSDSINGSYVNTTQWTLVDNTINGTYTNATTFHTVSNTINGSYVNTSIPLTWQTVDDTINGSYTNTTQWTLVDNSINGSYTNTTTFHTVDDTINGTYTNTTTYHTVDDAINGSYINTTQWKTVDDTINGSYTNTSIASIPTVIINFAGNLSDLGGPYWQPPGESTQLTGVWSDGYYTNDSRQHEDWIYVNTTITNATSVYLDWLNGSVWTNGTYSLTNTGGDFWEINTSGNITNIGEGYNYSFNINATGSGGNTIWEWNKTGVGGAYTRRYVQLNCTSTNISYLPHYLHNLSYLPGDASAYDRIGYDQAAGGGDYDAGLFMQDALTDEVQERYCDSVIGFWFGDDVCSQSFNIYNMYFHVWHSDTYNEIKFSYGVDYKDQIPYGGDYSSATLNVDDLNRSCIYYDGPTSNNWYTLNTYLLTGGSDLVTDNSVYNLVAGILGTDPSVISNQSFTTFIIINVPTDILDGTDNTTDTDNDGLSDHMELNTTYGYSTNPFLKDTDNDNINDYWEVQSGSDPNNYTETYNVSLSWNTVDDTINGSYTNTTQWTTVDDTINGSYTNTTTINLVTSVDPIVPYWQDDITSLQINVTSIGSEPDNVSLYYRHSYDNETWLNGTNDTFAFAGIDSSHWNSEGTICGSNGTVEFDGTVNNITIYAYSTTASKNAICGLYEFNGFSWDLIKLTEERLIPVTGSPQRYTFNFTGDKPVVHSGGNYGLFMIAEPGDGAFNMYLYYETGNPVGYYFEYYDYIYDGELPNNFVAQWNDTDSIYCIYASYTYNNWTRWYNDSNPYTGSMDEINWTFDFLQLGGYYEFYSNATLNNVNESTPGVADAICHVNYSNVMCQDVDTHKDFLTIEDAIADSDTLDGHTILVYDGNWIEEDVYIDKELTIIGESRENTIINTTSTAYYSFLIWSQSNVRISNMTLGIGLGIDIETGFNDNITMDNITFDNEWDAITAYTGTNSNITVDNCSFIDIGDQGIIFNPANDFVIKNCIFDNMTGAVPIQLQNSENGIVSNCSVNDINYNPNAYAVIFNGNCNNVTLSDLNLSGNDTDWGGIHIADASNITVENCVITNYTVDGISISASSYTTDNCTIKTNNITGCTLGLNVTGNNLKNSIIYDNYFSNTINAKATGTFTNVSWNITKTPGTNILGRDYLGGNYWDDYTGEDTDGDALGDTLLPYNCSNNIVSGGDYHPLTFGGIYWHTVDNTINGSYTNTTHWKSVSAAINGSYVNATHWIIVDNTINGSYVNTTILYWNTVDDTINGSYTNTTTFHTVSNTINGSYVNTSIPLTWQTVDDTINGTYVNTTHWKSVSTTINGTYTNTTQYHTVIDTINGSYSNTTQFHTVIDTINGSYTNTSISCPVWLNVTVDTLQENYTSDDYYINITDPPDPPVESAGYDYWYAPSNSFGMSSFKTINWTYFKQYLQNEFHYIATYKLNDAWHDGNQYLTFNKEWNQTGGYWKLKPSVNIPVDIQGLNVTFWCNKSVLQYVERNNYEIWFNISDGDIDTYSLYFNWSDIAEIPGLTFEKGIYDDKFYMRILRGATSAGYYEFDPTFGQTSGTVTSDFYSGMLLSSHLYSPASDGTADSIWVKIVDGTWSSGEALRCGLYDSSGNFIAETVERNDGGDGGDVFYEFVFNAPKPCVYSTEYYYIACYFGATIYAYMEMSSGNRLHYTGLTYPNWVDPASPVSKTTEFSAYCSYTEGECSCSEQTQSKIQSESSCNISGYLLMRLDYNDSGSWYTVEEVINETAPRTINASEYLKLDSIWNDHITVDNLTNGSGMYRIYVAFRNSDWSVMQNEDSSYVEGYCTFNYTGISWQTVDSTINGSYTNTTTYHVVSDTINGSYVNTTTFQTISNTINGSYVNTSLPLTWHTVDDTINGSYVNTSLPLTWHTVDDTINGSYVNTTQWTLVSNTINGSYVNTSIPLTWQTVDDTINGSYINTSLFNWQTVDSTINGSYVNHNLTIKDINITPPTFLPTAFVNVTCRIPSGNNITVATINFTSYPCPTFNLIEMSDDWYYYNVSYSMYGNYTFYLYAKDDSSDTAQTAVYYFSSSMPAAGGGGYADMIKLFVPTDSVIENTTSLIAMKTIDPATGKPTTGQEANIHCYIYYPNGTAMINGSHPYEYKTGLYVHNFTTKVLGHYLAYVTYTYGDNTYSDAGVFTVRWDRYQNYSDMQDSIDRLIVSGNLGRQNQSQVITYHLNEQGLILSELQQEVGKTDLQNSLRDKAVGELFQAIFSILVLVIIFVVGGLMLGRRRTKKWMKMMNPHNLATNIAFGGKEEKKKNEDENELD